MWVFYAYAGYMILLSLISLFKKKNVDIGKVEPFVTMIIAAFNEEKGIEQKIRNCFDLDYPKEKLEIIIVSDASTDRTDEIVKSFNDEIKFYIMDKRKGKTAAQNHAVRFAWGEVLVFSDATTVYKKDTVRNLVRNFSDKNVGIVAGEETGSSRDTGSRGNKALGEGRALMHKPVEMRRVHVGEAKRSDCVVALLICDDQDDVGS